jgi:hypothetical protein
MESLVAWHKNDRADAALQHWRTLEKHMWAGRVTSLEVLEEEVYEARLMTVLTTIFWHLRSDITVVPLAIDRPSR